MWVLYIRAIKPFCKNLSILYARVREDAGPRVYAIRQRDVIGRSTCSKRPEQNSNATQKITAASCDGAK